MAESDQGIGVRGRGRGIHRAANTGGVEAEVRTCEMPTLGGHTACQNAHETEPRLMQGAKTGQAHDGARRPAGNGGGGGAGSSGGFHVASPGPKLVSKNRYQLPPMNLAMFSAPKPMALRPRSILPKSRLSRNQGGCGGKPGLPAEPSP